MATNKLMEAAAEALASSKQSAPAEPMHKYQSDAEVVDLGGPKQDLENNKADGDIYDKYKLDASKAVKAKSAVAPTTHASTASAKQEEVENEEDGVIAEKMHDEEDMKKKEEMKKKMKEDIDALFADDSTIS